MRRFLLALCAIAVCLPLQACCGSRCCPPANNKPLKPLVGVRFMGFSIGVSNPDVTHIRAVYSFASGEPLTVNQAVQSGFAKYTTSRDNVISINFYCVVDGTAHFAGQLPYGSLVNNKYAFGLVDIDGNYIFDAFKHPVERLP